MRHLKFTPLIWSIKEENHVLWKLAINHLLEVCFSDIMLIYITLDSSARWTNSSRFMWIFQDISRSLSKIFVPFLFWLGNNYWFGWSWTLKNKSWLAPKSLSWYRIKNLILPTLGLQQLLAVYDYYTEEFVFTCEVS